MRLLKTVAINFAVLASLLLIAVIVLEFYVRWEDTKASNVGQRRAATPNYAGAAWAEQHFREVDALRTTFFSFVEWRRELFEGETVNVVGPYHERLTPPADGAKGGAVFFFGGSTMWGTGARDQETIPSYYGRIAGRPARNFGESGYVAHQSLEMLLWLLQEGERPDAVVFYEGVNDVMHRCRSGAAAFSQSQEGRMRALLAQEPGLFLRVWTLVSVKLASGQNEDSADRFDCDNDPAKARRVADALIDDWKLARLAAESEGIAFFAVLQPVIYFSDTIGDQRADAESEAEGQKRRQFEAVYPLIRDRLGEVGGIDLTGALDEQSLFYIDFCHLSPNGNERVAKALAAAIEPALAE
ncbi:MAG TPA: SGNH/GDSL hydrolase family protein [Kiloniellales bacterium]|nr:SGNH/GDSL hydrolase family protein [Kiloniellales bacterium]